MATKGDAKAQAEPKGDAKGDSKASDVQSEISLLYGKPVDDLKQLQFLPRWLEGAHTSRETSDEDEDVERRNVCCAHAQLISVPACAAQSTRTGTACTRTPQTPSPSKWCTCWCPTNVW